MVRIPLNHTHPPQASAVKNGTQPGLSLLGGESIRLTRQLVDLKPIKLALVAYTQESSRSRMSKGVFVFFWSYAFSSGRLQTQR